MCFVDVFVVGCIKSFNNPLFTAVCNTVNSLCFVVFFVLDDSSCSEFYVRHFGKHYVCFIIIGVVSQTPYTLCNFTMFSVSVCTQIGAVGEAGHTPTTERGTGRMFVFPLTVPASVA